MLGRGEGENNSGIMYSSWFRGTYHNSSVYLKHSFFLLSMGSGHQASDSKNVPVHLRLSPCFGLIF